MNPFRRNAAPAFRGDFPDDGRDITQVLGRADWDATAIEFTGASGTGLPDPGPATEPLARLRARGPRPDSLPALPALNPRETGPQQRLPRIARVQERPRPVRPADAAIFVWSDLLGQHIMKCGVCLRSRYADPVAAHMPFTFEALRVSAYVSGWRLDAFARWACPACQQTPGYRTPYPVIQWDGDAAGAYLAGDGQGERYHRDAAEHDLVRDVAAAARYGRHAEVTR